MVSKKTSKYIKSLQLKKNRKIEGVFLVEGAKNVVELLNSNFKATTILATSLFFKNQKQLLINKDIELIEASEEELASMGSFKSNNAAIAVAKIRENSEFSVEGSFVIALDRINDPGNLGTIMRIADWYGIRNIVCSRDCADQYNPKVIASSMGSFTRVDLYYTDLRKYLEAFKAPVYGAFLEGENVHQSKFDTEGLLLMGSESHGIHPELEVFVTKKISIPRYGDAESLNVATATAVICDNIRRR